MNRLVRYGLLATSIFVLPAHAEWGSIFKGKSTEILIDWGSLKFDGRIGSAWFVQNFERERDVAKWKNIQTMQIFGYFDCESEKYYGPITLLFSGTGNSRSFIGGAIFDEPKEMFKWESIDEWPVASLAWTEVCSRYKNSN